MNTNLLSHKQQLLLEAVRKLVRRGATPSLDRLLVKRHPVEIAALFSHLNDWEARILLSALLEHDMTFCAEVVLEMESSIAADCLPKLEHERLLEMFQGLSPDDATTLVRLLPEDVAREVVTQLNDDLSEEVEELLGYPPDTAGGLMSTDVFQLKEDVTVAEAISTLQQNSDTLSMAFYVYIVNDAEQLVGVLSLRSLLTNPPETRLKDIMITEVLNVRTHTDQEEVAETVARYDLVAIPVVDDYNKLMGIVTVDEVLDVLREEATEDILKMAGAAEIDMFSRSTVRSARMRLPWLLVTLFAGIVASEIIRGFDETLRSMLFLAGFMPVIVGLSGNAGNQSAALIARGISLSSIEAQVLWRYLFREIRVGFILGLLSGTLLLGFILLRYDGMLELAAVVGLSAGLSIICAMTFGVLSPLLLRRLHLDPNMATGPLVSTVVDVLGISIYFMLATKTLAWVG